MMERRVFGLKRDLPDPRDKHFRIDYLNVGKLRQRFMAYRLPAVVDLRKLESPPIYDQGRVGSCVDQALCTLLGIYTAKDGGGAELYSRLFAYYNARGGSPRDEGSSLRDALKGVSRYGICHESFWPYIEENWDKKPVDAAWNDAAPHAEGFEYYRLTTMSGMKICLSENVPFMFGMMLYESFMGGVEWFDNTVPMPKPYESPVGGHAMTMVGYDDNKQVFIVRNSWGPTWAENGYCYLPYAYVQNSDYFMDAWTVRYIRE